MHVLHSKPSLVKRGPIESLAHPPRSVQLGVSVHNILDLYLTTRAISVEYTPLATQSGVSSGSLDACAYLSFDVLVEHKTRRYCIALLGRKGPAEIQADIYVAGFNAKVVHRMANR